MKLRIKGNSIRIRLARKEVATIAEIGYIDEQTHFGENVFTYALKKSEHIDSLSAVYENNTMTMLVPDQWVKDWPNNDQVGLAATITLTDGKQLMLLLEKDFVCLDETTEDQSDHYPNPNHVC